MIKYHKNIGFKSDDVFKCKTLIDILNQKNYTFSKHSLLELLKENEADKIGQCIKDYTLNFDDVFEIVIDNNNINKIGFRIPYNNENDIVFMLSIYKKIITIWINEKNDFHNTLNKSLYANV